MTGQRRTREPGWRIPGMHRRGGPVEAKREPGRARQPGQRVGHEQGMRHSGWRGWRLPIWTTRVRQRLCRPAALAVAGVLAVGGLAAGGWPATASAASQDLSCGLGQCTVSFLAPGTGQSFTVPVGVTSLTVTMYGAIGGTNDDLDVSGGAGAEVIASLSVTAGEVLGVDVGGAGGGGVEDASGGVNGGGSSSGGGGGGGATDLTAAGTPLLVAGGGGGAGSSPTGFECSKEPTKFSGGAGGNAGTAGSSGEQAVDGDLTLDGGGGGAPGTVTGPGAGGSSGGFTGTQCTGAIVLDGESGNPGSGSDGGSGTEDSAGGGGGGGYTGGGAGGTGAGEVASVADEFAGAGGGGGGSSYTGGAGVSDAFVSNTGNSGLIDPNGEVVLGYTDPVATGAPAYSTLPGQALTVPVGSGLLSGTADTTAPAGDTLTATGPASGNTAEGGAVTVNSDGSFTYSPPAGFTGSDSFSYTVTDPSGDYATGTATIDVVPLDQTVMFTSSPPSPADYGGSYTPAGSASSGLTVGFTIDATSTPGACAISGSTVDFTGTGTCVIDANQGGDLEYAAAQAQQSFTISPAATNSSVVVTASALTVTVTVVPPGAGEPSGTVTFAVGGTTVGTAPLNSSGTASLAYTSSGAETVSAVYAGNADYLASSASTATTNPVIVATLSSSHPESSYGWYSAPVTVSFTCAPGSAPLTAPCPGPVTLSKNGADQAVTKTIHDTDGGIATASVAVNIDQTKPALTVTGIKNKTSYDAPGPATISCTATETISGLAAPCKLTVKRTETAITWTATATSRAGNTTTVTGNAALTDFYIAGAKLVHGRFVVTAGNKFTLEAYFLGAVKAPEYTGAARAPAKPGKTGPAMKLTATSLWAIGVTIPAKAKAGSWSLGILEGGTLHIIPITVQL